MIHIVLPVHNRLEITKNFLFSLKQQKNFEELNTIVVDDGSTDGTKDFLLKNFPWVTILNGTGSLFWGGAVHYGIDYVMKICKEKDWVLLVNNDIELSSDAILNLKNISEINNRKVIAGALSLNILDKQTVVKSGTIVESWLLNKTKHVYNGLKLNEIINTNPVEVDLLTGRCLLHPAEIFNLVGNYDAKTFQHYGGDDEFSMRIKKFGYLCLLCPSSIVFLNPNQDTFLKKISLKNFLYILFNKKSSFNIISKFYLAKKAVPIYAKISFFIIGMLKSLLFFIK